MISTGYDSNNSTTKTEVIDLENNNVECKDLDNFPLEIRHAVSANLASMPIICGGWLRNAPIDSSDKCFRYMEGEWQHFATMIDRRYGAAGIVYDNALHIFGGYDSKESTRLQSSEIINEDGNSVEGPQLPELFHLHAIASINSTVSIITGGFQGSNYISDQTWYFNHATQEFQLGPNLLEGRNSHSSGTITDQNTKEKLVIVAGGGSDVYMNSTEILLNGEWVTGKNHICNIFVHFMYLYLDLAISKLFLFLKLGPALPYGLFGHSMVELGENLYTIGGFDGSGYQKEIQKLACASATCSWTTLTKQLKVGRNGPVSIPVMDSFCTRN